jgi:protein TonB
MTPEQQAEVTAWRDVVVTKIRSRTYFPRDPNLPAPMMSGAATVRFSVAANGTIYTPQIVRASAEPLYNAAALTIVLSTAPLPPPPAFLLKNSQPVSLVVPIAFDLPRGPMAPR